MEKSDKIALFILVIFLIISLGVQQWIIYHNPKQDDILERIERKLDSLSNKKDSIRLVIDTIDKEIIKNEVLHEKTVNNIINMPESDLDSFTRQYIYQFAESRGFNIR